MDKHTPLFYEVQRFRAWWIWLIVLGISGYFFLATVRQVFIEHPIGTNPSLNEVPVTAFVLSLALVALLWFMRLETRIMADGIYTRFFPFARFKKRSWNDIQRLHIRKYRPLIEYGGWGIRGLGDNRALNVSGNIGLQTRMASGKRMLIGTKQPQAMDAAVRQIPALSDIYLPLTPDFDE